MASSGPADRTPSAADATDQRDAGTQQTQPGQAANPLHGVTLEAMVTALADHYGWENLGQRISIRCFTSDPSVASSLKFLRKTPWAREKVEGLYLYMLREIRRTGPTVHNFPPPRR